MLRWIRRSPRRVTGAGFFTCTDSVVACLSDRREATSVSAGGGHFCGALSYVPQRFEPLMQAVPQESTSSSPPSIWRNTGDMTPPDPGSMLFFWTVLMIVVMLPVWGAVLGLLSLLELAKGVPVSFIETIQEPIFLWSMLISVLMLPVMLACMSMTPTVMQFAFDMDRQVLTYIEVRPYRKPVEVEVPFDAIRYVAPYKVRQFDRIGRSW